MNGLIRAFSQGKCTKDNKSSTENPQKSAGKSTVANLHQIAQILVHIFCCEFPKEKNNNLKYIFSDFAVDSWVNLHYRSISVQKNSAASA